MTQVINNETNQVIKLIKIGAGHFSTAYTTPQLKDCYILSRCMAKEAYALGFNDEASFYPDVQKCWDFEVPTSKEDEYNWYRMPLYTKVKAPSQQLKYSDHLLYKALRKMQKELNYAKHSFYGLDVIREGFDSLIEQGIDERTIEQLQGLLDLVCNGVDTRSVRFEISPRNIALDALGNMILLDCFYDQAEI